MNKCDYCSHVEMCGWRKSLEDRGCDFFDDENKWIPVSERLPEENKTVIASTLYGVFPEARYTKEYGWEWAYEAGADYWRELEDVLAWMPLPEQYKVRDSKTRNK